MPWRSGTDSTSRHCLSVKVAARAVKPKDVEKDIKSKCTETRALQKNAPRIGGT